MLKSILSILYAILILFTPQIQAMSKEDNSIDFRGHVFSVELGEKNLLGGAVSTYKGGSVAMVIESKEELDDFFRHFEKNDVSKVFFEFMEEKSEDYFKKKCLIVNVLSSDKIGIGLKLTDIVSVKTGITVKYNYYDGADMKEDFPSVKCNYILVAEVDKDDIPKQCYPNTEAYHVYSRKDL